MHPYAEVLHKYLEDNPLHTCTEDPAGLLDLLYCCYRQHYNKETPQAKEYYHQLNALLQELPVEDNDDVFNLTIALSEEYRRQSFREGVTAGLRIFHELYRQ